MKDVQFTPHFNSKEFDSPDEQFSGLKMNSELIRKLEILRLLYDKPIVISSGYRTKAHNKKVGGVADSSHLSGNAVDIFIKNSNDRYRLVCIALLLEIPRIGVGSGFLHLDISIDKPNDIMYLY